MSEIKTFLAQLTDSIYNGTLAEIISKSVQDSNGQASLENSVITCKFGNGENKALAVPVKLKGLTVSAINPCGKLQVQKDLENAVYYHNSPVAFPNGVLGLTAIKNQEIYLAHRAEAFTAENMYIDIGTKNKEESEKLISIGAKAYFSASLHSNNLAALPSASDLTIHPYAGALAGVLAVLLALPQIKEGPGVTIKFYLDAPCKMEKQTLHISPCTACISSMKGQYPAGANVGQGAAYQLESPLESWLADSPGKVQAAFFKEEGNFMGIPVRHLNTGGEIVSIEDIGALSALISAIYGKKPQEVV